MLINKPLPLVLVLIIVSFLSGCYISDIASEDINKLKNIQGSNDIGEAEKVAQGFAIAMQNKDFQSLYYYFIPSLKSQRSKSDFVKFLTVKYQELPLNLIYDKTVKQDDKIAYAYYTASSGIIQLKTPAIRLDYIDGQGWKIDGFAEYFMAECAMDSCDDLNKCTKDSCSSSTGFECSHQKIEDCCYTDYDCSSSKPVCNEGVCGSSLSITTYSQVMIDLIERLQPLIYKDSPFDYTTLDVDKIKSLRKEVYSLKVPEQMSDAHNHIEKSFEYWVQAIEKFYSSVEIKENAGNWFHEKYEGVDEDNFGLEQIDGLIEDMDKLNADKKAANEQANNLLEEGIAIGELAKAEMALGTEKLTGSA